MNIKDVKKLFEECMDKIDDLADLKRYPPFSIFFEKRNDIDAYIQKKYAGPMHAGQDVASLNENGEYEVDNSKTSAIEKWESISASLELGDDDIPGPLKRDVEEARLYRKRHNNNPREAMLKASEVYKEANISMVPQ